MARTAEPLALAAARQAPLFISIPTPAHCKDPVAETQPSPSELQFGRSFTGKSPSQTRNHVLKLEWTTTQGWSSARIVPYDSLRLDPASCVIHYAFASFEGIKAYKDRSGNTQAQQVSSSTRSSEIR
ncbi:hypothetical protein BDW71DRAFT_211607 [Aspergillus fruticulosus]